MKIGIDISQIVYKGTGVARFIEGLVKAICQYDKQNEWVFFFTSFRQALDPSVEKLINSRGWKIVKMKLPPTALSIMWNDLHVFKIETMVGEIDWFISSDWTEPPSKCKKATIVHDLVYLRYPEVSQQKTVVNIPTLNISPNIVKTQKHKLDWVNKESEIIFADSKTTKEDLISLLNFDPDKVIVNYPGIGTGKSGRKKKSKKPFILTVGKIEPRKNMGRLIEAFEKLNPKNVELLIVGPEGWDQDLKVNRNVKFTGYVSDDELASLYSSCLFFIYPSIWEGFGYPVLEAMSLGAPVATSNTSSLKELGQNVALLFDPMKVDEIKNALQKLISSNKLRKELSRKGKQRVKDFTWKKYYDVMIKALW